MAEPEKHIEAAAFEPTDLGEGFIWGVVGICVAVLLACALVVAWLYPQAATDRSSPHRRPISRAALCRPIPPPTCAGSTRSSSQQLNGPRLTSRLQRHATGRDRGYRGLAAPHDIPQGRLWLGVTTLLLLSGVPDTPALAGPALDTADLAYHERPGIRSP